MADELTRFSVAMPESLVQDFDDLVSRRGVSCNRSELVRDLVRDAVAESKIEGDPHSSVMGTLTIMYNHHASDLADRLHDVQHDYCDEIVSTVHVHVDAHTCLEVIILRGECELVQHIADRILGTRGVDLGKLVITSIDEGAPHDH